MPQGRAFIETSRFPVSEISEASAKEKGPGRPPHWEMVFWWTRKPLISARAIIAGSLLPENTDRESFLLSIGVKGKGSPHRKRPSYRFENVRLLDPFAGFGSIPLEALRLGLSATGVELIPVAYVFLKAILEYPSKHGKSLINDVKRWGDWVTDRLREDPDIEELYDEDVVAYIGSWEIKCPNCSRWTPLVGKWWLMRVESDKGYERLTWMEPKIEGYQVDVNVTDFKFSDDGTVEVSVKENEVIVGKERYRVPESNIEPRREQAICLVCNQPIRYFDWETGRHVLEPSPGETSKLVWYIKYALSRYNEGDESLGKHRLLVKVKVVEGRLEFESCTIQDQQRLEIARQKIRSLIEQNDPNIPLETISAYSVRYLFPILYGVAQWCKLFNPRQLLTLVKLTNLIREAGKSIELEKMKEGLSREEALKYAGAVVAWLSLVLLRYVDYNSICNQWNYGGHWGLHAQFAHTLSMRGIAMMWNWGDVSPFADMGGTGTFIVSLRKAINSLEYLVLVNNSLSEGLFSESGVNIKENRVLLDDSTALSKLSSDDRFDLIVTDPPYYDDVPYSELSDFYYVWLKRTLSDIKDGKLSARFLPEAFFEKIEDEWIEIPTQWERYALSEVSLNPPRLGPNTTIEDGIKHFQNLLNASFATMTSRLKDEGLLVTYYAHTDPDAWKALLEAGWQSAGLRVTNAFPVATESAQSVVSRGKLSMDTSIVVVWRKGSEGFLDASVLYEQMAEGASNRAKELIDMGTTGRDLVIGTLASALAIATKYREVRVMGKLNVRELVDKYVYPATLLGLARALARKAELKDSVRSPDAMFYLIVKFTLSGARKKILESTDARIFSIGTSLDLNQAIKTSKILRGESESAGAKVAKPKTLTLVEPTSAERSKLAELVEAKEVGITDPKIRCTVDALHILEYYAVTYSREEFRRKCEELKAKYLSQVEEAVSVSKIMARVLPEEDVEKSLCVRITEHLEPTLGSYTGGES